MDTSSSGPIDEPAGAADPAQVAGLLACVPSRLGGAALLQSLRDALALRRQVDALVLGLIAEVEKRGLAGELGAADTAALVRVESGLGPRAARRWVATASGVAHDEALASLVGTGALGAEAAAVVVSSLGRLPRDLDRDTYSRARGLLLEWAGQFDLEALRRLATRLVARVVAERTGTDTLEAAEARAYANRGLWLSRVGAGWVLRADLDAEVGSMLAAMIDACSRPTPDPEGRDPDAGTLDRPSLDGRTADGARVDGCKVAGRGVEGDFGVEGHDGGVPADGRVRDPRTPAKRRADALERILRSAVAHGDLPVHGGLRPTISVLTDFESLRDQVAGVGGVDEQGDPLSAAAVRRLACDADVLPVVLGTQSEVLDLGRTARLVPAPLRRALVVRDRGCAWPGCDRPPAWCDAHHLVHWIDGGESSLDNCLLLCRRHHTRAHKGDWQIQIGALGAEFVPPRWIDPGRTPRRNTRDHHPDPGRALRDLAPRREGHRPAAPRPPART